MPEVTILTERELRDCVALDRETVDVIEGAFAALARGGVVMPPILSMAIADRHGEVDVKTAYVPGLPAFAIKISPGFFNNPKLGLPSLNGLMVVLDAATGIVNAVLLDNGYLTDVRTAAAGAVAARHLAPQRVETAGVIGAGVQAELQMAALALVRPFERLLVWSRDAGKAQACAARLSSRLGRPAAAVDAPATLVRECQVVVTTTPSRAPLIRAEWLHPGLHITAMGSDAPEKNELDPRIVAVADRFVCDRLSQSRNVGELRAAIVAGTATKDREFGELGAICAGRRPGRLSADEITVCDLTGTGVQDTAIAVHALAAARARGLGRLIEN